MDPSTDSLSVDAGIEGGGVGETPAPSLDEVWSKHFDKGEAAAAPPATAAPTPTESTPTVPGDPAPDGSAAVTAPVGDKVEFDRAELLDGATKLTYGDFVKVKDEMLDYKMKWRAAEEQAGVLAKFGEADRSFLTNDFLPLLTSDNPADLKQAALLARNIAALLDPDGDDPATTGGDVGLLDDPSTPPPGTLTAEQVQKLITDALASDRRAQSQQAQEMQAQRLREQAVTNLNQTLKAAGIEPESREALNVVWIARNETGNDIDAAIKAYKEDQQRVIDRYVESKRGDSRFKPSPRGGDAPARPEANDDQDWSEIRKGADQYLQRFV